MNVSRPPAAGASAVCSVAHLELEPMYTTVGSLSGYGPWRRNTAETDEVYVWRGLFDGAHIKTQQDLQAIVASVGKNQSLNFDIRGVTVKPLGDRSNKVEVAFTTKIPRVYALDPGFVTDNAQSIAEKLEADLASRFGPFRVEDVKFLQIDDDEPKHPALDFWTSHPILWDQPIFGTAKPTQAWENFEGMYQGSVDQGLSLKRWQNPSSPGSGNEDPEKDQTILWVAGGAALLFAGFFLMRKGAAKR